ncbi:SWIM zinc finger family protein [Streptomyces avermitilis]|uniref:SWIM zinc finger family protein n=1 Tax=Streptomyces avermitilis TaxID=33903 RepID=UPI0034090C84
MTEMTGAQGMEDGAELSAWQRAADGADPRRSAEEADEADVTGPQRPAGEVDASGSQRPADVARRALRAARGRDTRGADAADADARAHADTHAHAHVHAHTEAEPVRDADPTASDETSGRRSRPGDVAREALRRATARGSAAGSGEGAPPAPDSPAEPSDPAERGESGESGESGKPGESGEGGELAEGRSGLPAVKEDAPAGRPGDVARRALRAARDDAKQGQREARAGGVGAARRSAGASRTDSRERQGAPGEGEGDERRNRARELREFLAGAFVLPADDPTDLPADGLLTDALPADAARRDETRIAFSAHAEDEVWRGTPAPTTDRRTDERETEPRPPTAPSRPLTGSAPSEDTPDQPSAPRVPRSMAAPGRDGELRRTFAALPARTGDGVDVDRFAETWWGDAWVSALEEGALDAARLARGRAYAGQGHVDAITVTPGLVLAYVHGSRPRPYRVQVRLRTLSDDDWDRFLDAAAERPGHIAALLDKEMPHSLADCGIPLLPEPRDLDPQCSCPDSGHPCKHAAALCYQTARLLDEDPFVLLLLRGRGEREVLDALSRRNAARAARAAQEQEPAPLPGVRARDALARRSFPPLPAPLPPPPHPEQPPVYPAAPGGPDPFALDQLATDAAARAHALLTAGRDPVAELTLWQDAVRLAAARPGSGLTAATRALYASLATAAARTTGDLARAVAAWRQGGLEGLAVLEEPWDPPAGRFDRARPLLLAADLPAFRPWRNRLTHPKGHAQLRLGHDGLWYAYESEPGHDDWWPRGTPDLDPVGALTGLGAPEEA